MRAQAPRRCVDVAGSIMHHVVNRAYVPSAGGDPPVGTGGLPWSVQPHSSYVRRMLPPAAVASNPASGICTQVRAGRGTWRERGSGGRESEGEYSSRGAGWM